jgi:hypothetical protein
MPCLAFDYNLPMRKRLAVGLVLLAACAEGSGGMAPTFIFARSPQGAVRYDYDGDGFAGPWVCPTDVAGCDAVVLNNQPLPNLDCDDHNGAIHPGAPDAPGDGIDSDCDGADGTKQLIQP